MRNFVVTLMASSVLVFAGAASAADAIDSIPEAPQAYDQPATGNWGGAYVGGSANYNVGRFSGSSFDDNAFGGQLFGGYNVQQGQLIYGGEADLGYSGIDNTKGGVDSSQGLNGSVRARIGVDAGPAMVYGTAGVAATRIEAKDATTSDDRNSLGWTAGAGAETMISDGIFARAEYRYTDYQSKTMKLATPGVKRGYDEHSLKIGVGVKF